MMTAPRLPDVPAGAPGNARISLDVLLIRDTPNAILVTAPRETPGKTVWLPRSLTYQLQPTGNIIRHDRPAGGARIAFQTWRVNIPVWLYRKVQLSLC